MSDTTSTIQQGWLNTREGDKFAPNTLIENVFTRSGVKYDEHVRNYIAKSRENVDASINNFNEIIENVESSVNNINQNIEDKFKNFNTDDSNTFFIIDNNENVIAYVNHTGVHSIDFETKNGIKLSQVSGLQAQLNNVSNKTDLLESQIDEVSAAISNIGSGDDGSLFVIDNNDNVIAYIDATGIHSVNLHIKDKISYVDLVNKVDSHQSSIDGLSATDNAINQRINEIKEDIQFFNGDESDTLFITDGTEDQNVIAYFDKEGLHVVDVLDKDGSKLSQLFTQMSNIIGRVEVIEKETIPGINASINDLSDKINSNTTYINQLKEVFNITEYNDKVFFSDNEGNVIAYFDGSGIHGTNLIIGGSQQNPIVYDLYETLGDLLQADVDINLVIQNILEKNNGYDASINDFSTRIRTLETKVNTDIPEEFAEVRQEVADGLAQEILDRNAAIKTAVDAEAETREAADNALSSRITDNEEYINSLNEVFNILQYDDKIFFIDKTADQNVVAYIDASGIHSVNLTVGNKNQEQYKLYETLISLLDEDVKLNNLIDGLKKKDEGFEGSFNNVNSRIDNIFNNFLGEDESKKPASTHKNQLDNHEGRLNSVEKRLENVSNVMDFVGVFSTETERDSDNENRNDGDVCIVGVKEYVYSEGSWHEIGDVSAEAGRITQLETNVNGLTAATNDINDRLSHIGNYDGDTFFITDGTDNQNVIAYFNKDGLTATDVTVKDMKNNKNKNLINNGIYIDSNETINVNFL